MIDQPPEALVRGCNDPINIGVLSDWIEEQYGIALDLDRSGWSESVNKNYGYSYGWLDGDGYGIGYGRISVAGDGFGNGYGNGYWRNDNLIGDGNGHGIGYGSENKNGNGFGNGYYLI